MTNAAPNDTRTRSQKKHEDILWAATKLFATKGIGHTSTREIAAAAETTERTLFKHFQSKEGLVRAVIAEAVVPHLAQAGLADVKALIGANNKSLMAWHAHMLEVRRNAIEMQAELTRLLLMEILRDDAVRREFGARWKEQVWVPLKHAFGQLQKEGMLSPEYSADTLSRIFLSLNIGYLISRIILAPDADWHDDSDVADLAAFFATGAKGKRGKG